MTYSYTIKSIEKGGIEQKGAPRGRFQDLKEARDYFSGSGWLLSKIA